MKRVCIVTPDYLSSTPRVVKEADALASAGFAVRVVFTQGDLMYLRGFDEALTASRPWRAVALRWSRGLTGERASFHVSRLRQWLSKRVFQATPFAPGAAERSAGRHYPELLRAALAEPADLFIGHYPAGLAVAAQAAMRSQTRYAYDFEDCYAAEDEAGQRPSLRSRWVRTLEERYVRGCAYVSASSRPIAGEVEAMYGLRDVLVLHNAFPWSDRQGLDGLTKDRQGPALSLYWISQTVGRRRGLEDLIRAAGRLRVRVQLHLRGTWDPGSKDSLESLARECGILDRLYVHPPVPPHELLSRNAEHDLAFALEQPVSRNRMLAASNKLLHSLVAGVPVIATDTPGQRSVVETLGDAARHYAPGDVDALETILQEFATDSSRLARAKTAALEAARTRWNWERESQALVARVNEVVL